MQELQTDSYGKTGNNVCIQQVSYSFIQRGLRGFVLWIIIGSDRRPETKQGIEGKIVTCRSGRVRDY